MTNEIPGKLSCTGFVHFFRPKIQGLSRTIYLEISRISFNDNFTSKPRKMFLLTSIFSWPSHCLADFLRILFVLLQSCASNGSPRLTLPLHLGPCSYCKQNKMLCLNSCHIFEAMTYRDLFPAIFH